MSGRTDDQYRRARSRSRDRSYRDERRDRSRDRRERDDGRVKEKKRYDERGRSGSPRPSKSHRAHSRSRSPARRRSRSPRRHRSDSHQKRSRSRSMDSVREKRRERSLERRRHSRSRSRSMDSSSSSSSEHRRPRKKDKHKKKKRSRSRDRKERKKDKKKKKGHGAAVGHQWGKYGIINETDQYNKEAEFRTWLVEERKINPETVSKDQTRKEFAKFVEDYNTATLPHEKFYDISSYETRMAALRSGEFVPPPDDGYDPNADLRALQGTHKRKPKEQDSYMSREQLMELRKVQAERIEVGKMKLLGMDIKQNLGVRMDGTMFDD